MREKSSQSTVRRAVVDIGSHGIKYLIADVEVQGSQSRLKKIVRTGNNRAELARGMGVTPRLTEAAMRRGLRVLREFRKIFEDEDVDEALIAATSAVRTARNRALFCARAAKALKGIPLKVLSQSEEGYFGYEGALASFEELQENSLEGRRNKLVIDIGGGSIEATLNGKLLSIFELGAVRFSELYLKGHVPLLERDLIRTDATLQEKMAPMVRKMGRILGRKARPFVVGIGEFKDAAKFVENKQDLFKGGRRIVPLKKANLEHVYRKMSKLNLHEIKDKFPIASNEPRNALAAVILARALMVAFNVEELPVSPWGLRHGLLLTGPWRSRFAVRLGAKHV